NDKGQEIPLKAVHVDGDDNGTQEDVNVTWTPDGSGGGVLTSVGEDSGQPVFTLLVQPDGDYTLTMHAPLAHPFTDQNGGNSPDSEWEDNLKLVFQYPVTDGDDDTATATLTADVDDDTPDPVCDEREATLTPGAPGESANIVLVFDR